MDSREEIITNKERLEGAIRSFGISAAIVGVTRGPTVTRYDIELDQGVKLARVTNLAGDLALALGVVNVRIAPIPDKISTVGIEVPNKIVSTVYLRDIIESPKFTSAKSKLSFALGKDIGGDCIVGNIAKLPHMLIAGTTGSGKSVCMNSLILSLLYKARPDEVRLIMIDPKMVELGIYNGIPHLYVPVVTDPKKAAGALQWSVVEMLKRYRLFSEVGVRDLESYNKHCVSVGEQTLPQVVIVIDELADLMLVASKEVEESICRVAQMGRAAGMHLVIATQRPSADVITGLMKANIPSRIAFAVSSAMESRIILDQGGAEKLVGMGDMLFSPVGCGKPVRIQGAFVSDEEREDVIRFIKEGAGAFVCGEETALIASLEGQRGTPRFRPPFPTDKGWMGHPSMINNVETFGNVPLILREGAAAFASVGTEGSKGTKLFALAGDLKHPGLVEVPMGTTLREIVFDIGGADPEKVKAVQTGGPSGGCIPVELFDTPVDYDSLRKLGAIMGSGGMIVIGKDRCMVETARYFLDFTHRESCGKCTFCRVGTTRMYETLERIVAGKGSMEDLALLEDLGPKIRMGSLCGLGQTAPNPVLATLRYYRHEYEAHVRDRQCDALQCNALVDLKLDQSKCVKCRLCIKNCPVGAISDDFVVDNTKCTRCNTCVDICPKKAISRVKKGSN